jgi:hypothetical protein
MKNLNPMFVAPFAVVMQHRVYLASGTRFVHLDETNVAISAVFRSSGDETAFKALPDVDTLPDVLDTGTIISGRAAERLQLPNPMTAFEFRTYIQNTKQADF